MATKNFIPQLVRIANKLCNYINKHYATLQSTLGPTSPEWTALTALFAACQAFGAIVTAEREEA